MNEVNNYDEDHMIIDIAKECNFDKECHFTCDTPSDMAFHLGKHHYGRLSLEENSRMFDKLVKQNIISKDTSIALKLGDRLLHIGIDMEDKERMNLLLLEIAKLSSLQKDSLIRAIGFTCCELGHKLNEMQRELTPSPYDFKKLPSY